MWQMYLVGSHGGRPGSQQRNQPWALLRGSPGVKHRTHTSGNPDSWICVWIHDGWAIISQWPKTTFFSLWSNRYLFQGEKIPSGDKRAQLCLGFTGCLKISLRCFGLWQNWKHSIIMVIITIIMYSRTTNNWCLLSSNNKQWNSISIGLGLASVQLACGK